MKKYFIFLCVLLWGCVEEKMADCPPVEPATNTIETTIRAFQNTGAELSSDIVRNVRLFLYNDDMHFIRSVDTKLGQQLSIDVPNDTDIHVIAWGNLNSEFQLCEEPQPGQHITDHCVNLIERSFTGTGAVYYISPGDLFRADFTVWKEYQGEQRDVTLDMVREVGCVTMTVRGLKEHFGFDDDNYSIVLNGRGTCVDFEGNLTGGATTYRPAGGFGGNGVEGEYFVWEFNTLPSDGMKIDIYHGNDLLDSVTKDYSGKTLHVGKGIQTNLLIVYSDPDTGGEEDARLDVRLAITDWGKTMLWKDFGSR